MPLLKTDSPVLDRHGAKSTSQEDVSAEVQRPKTASRPSWYFEPIFDGVSRDLCSLSEKNIINAPRQRKPSCLLMHQSQRGRLTNVVTQPSVDLQSLHSGEAIVDKVRDFSHVTEDNILSDPGRRRATDRYFLSGQNKDGADNGVKDTLRQNRSVHTVSPDRLHGQKTERPAPVSSQAGCIRPFDNVFARVGNMVRHKIWSYGGNSKRLRALDDRDNTVTTSTPVLTANRPLQIPDIDPHHPPSSTRGYPMLANDTEETLVEDHLPVPNYGISRHASDSHSMVASASSFPSRHLQTEEAEALPSGLCANSGNQQRSLLASQFGIDAHRLGAVNEHDPNQNASKPFGPALLLSPDLLVDRANCGPVLPPPALRNGSDQYQLEQSLKDPKLMFSPVSKIIMGSASTRNYDFEHLRHQTIKRKISSFETTPKRDLYRSTRMSSLTEKSE